MQEDRDAAIDFLCDLDDDKVAVESLLQRFEYSLEHGIKDSKEKERVLKGITKRGESVVPIIRDHLKSTSRIAWPIKALRGAAGDDEAIVIDTLKDCLDFGEVSFDQSKVDKNFDILCYLRDYKLPGYADKIAHFLKDPDERVRFAALEVLIEQDEDNVPEHIEKFLSDNSSENTRLRQATIEAFLDHQWKLKNPQVFESGSIIPGIRINKAGQLSK